MGVGFQIKHYAGTVTYQAAGFLEKNRNAPSLGIASMLKASGNAMIASLFKSSETTEERLERDKAMATAMKRNDGAFMRRQSQRARFGKKHLLPEKKEAPKKKLAPWQIQNMKG